MRRLALNLAHREADFSGPIFRRDFLVQEFLVSRSVIVKSRSVSDRKTLGDALFSVLTSYVAACLYALAGLIAAWLAPKVRRALDWLGAHLLDRSKALPQSYSMPAEHGSFAIAVPPAHLHISSTPPQLPPGTASAIATAMQDPPQRRQFPNSSSWMQWDAYQRQHNLSAVFAMHAAQHGYAHSICTTGTAGGPSLW